MGEAISTAMPAAVAEGMARIEGIAPLASHRISFHRDETDSFALTVEPMEPPPGRDGRPAGGHAHGGPPAGRPGGHQARPVQEARPVQKEDVLGLLPRGSHWNPAVGWRSFVALPFHLDGVCAAAVGLEGVVPHASRGAFPLMRAFLLPAANVEAALLRLAATLPPGGRVFDALLHRCVIEISEASSPRDHESHEGAMLRAAAEAWRFGEPRLLRTLLLSDDQVPRPRRLADRLRALATDAPGPAYLAATVPAIRAHFSAATRRTLLRKELLG